LFLYIVRVRYFMSSTLYYRIVKPTDDEYLSDDLKFILREKFDLVSGDTIRLDGTKIDYLKGLADANIDGAKTLVIAIEKYDAVDVWIG